MIFSPEALERWWAPAGYAVLQAEVDARVGGRYSLEMRRSGDLSYRLVLGPNERRGVVPS